MTGPMRLAELDGLLERVQRGGVRYGVAAHQDGSDARRAVREQFVELAQLLTPAEGSPLQVARQVIWQRLRFNLPAEVCDSLARELVGALGLFARPGAE